LSFEICDLIRFEKGKIFTLNIKKIQSESNFILGEPIFKKYFAVLDYSKSRIGVS
jgi:hypothetical protein